MNNQPGTSDYSAETDHDTPTAEVIAADSPVLDKTVEAEAPISAPPAPETSMAANAESFAALRHGAESEYFRTLWTKIQGRFVDEPLSSVQDADALLSDVIEKIKQALENEHTALKSQWHQKPDTNTEELRLILQHYRAFFNNIVT